VIGGSGNNTFIAGVGNETFNGGLGTTTLSFNNVTHDVFLGHVDKLLTHNRTAAIWTSPR